MIRQGFFTKKERELFFTRQIEQLDMLQEINPVFFAKLISILTAMKKYQKITSQDHNLLLKYGNYSTLPIITGYSEIEKPDNNVSYSSI